MFYWSGNSSECARDRSLRFISELKANSPKLALTLSDELTKKKLLDLSDLFAELNINPPIILISGKREILRLLHELKHEMACAFGLSTFHDNYYRSSATERDINEVISSIYSWSPTADCSVSAFCPSVSEIGEIEGKVGDITLISSEFITGDTVVFGRLPVTSQLTTDRLVTHANKQPPTISEGQANT